MDVTMASLTENVDVTELSWDFFQKRGDLIFVRNIKSNGDEISALLDACFPVRSSTLLCHVLQGIRSACSENDVCTTLTGMCLSVADKC